MKKANSSGTARNISKTPSTKKVTVKKRGARKSLPKKNAKATSKRPTIPGTGSLAVRIAAAKKIEAMDRPKAVKTKSRMARERAMEAAASRPQRNSDFPNTYIAEISVRL